MTDDPRPPADARVREVRDGGADVHHPGVVRPFSPGGRPCRHALRQAPARRGAVAVITPVAG